MKNKLTVAALCALVSLQTLCQSLPTAIYSGLQGKNHVQGVAYDSIHSCLYLSFTTSLIKIDLQGNLLGSVQGLTGHLGCIALNPQDGKIYGSIEYKHDEIGQGIQRTTGEENDAATGFYIAIVDGERITRPNQPASEVMTTVYLPDVVRDVQAEVVNQGRVCPHRYGASGIDGVAFAPSVGRRGGRMLLYVAYGIYLDVERTDNDYQVLLCYDVKDWDRYRLPLDARHLHTSGPSRPRARYFVRTGNTSWGIQNLAYDAVSGHLLAAVYPGKKAHFPNYSLFCVDRSAKPSRQVLEGVEPRTQGRVLPLVEAGLHDVASGVWGWHFPYGATGMAPLGGGYYYLSHNGRDEATGREYTYLYLYRWSEGEGMRRVMSEEK
ncbi:MAG: hypothetical protein HUK03_08900 [Bacteroidaceae bacterium]|nr:hypothetical protein [Bacteroidaceae bacterium]